MTIEEFRTNLDDLLAASRDLPVRDVLEELESACEALRGDVIREDRA
jgi:hypothetical protein